MGLCAGGLKTVGEGWPGLDRCTDHDLSLRAASDTARVRVPNTQVTGGYDRGVVGRGQASVGDLPTGATTTPTHCKSVTLVPNTGDDGGRSRRISPLR